MVTGYTSPKHEVCLRWPTSDILILFGPLGTSRWTQNLKEKCKREVGGGGGRPDLGNMRGRDACSEKLGAGRLVQPPCGATGLV